MSPPFVVFGLPSLGHSVFLGHHTAMRETDRLLVQRGIGIGDVSIGGDCYLWKVRAKIATMFLRDFPDATDLFFLDDDVGFPPAKVIEFLLRPQDILVGAYPKKSDALDFPIELMGDASGRPIENGGLYRTLSAGAGFCRIKRRVLESLAKVVPTFREHPDGPEFFAFFAEGVVDGFAWGEDKYFFALAQQNGFEIWCDPDIDFIHRGGKTWKARLSDHLAAFVSPQQENAA